MAPRPHPRLMRAIAETSYGTEVFNVLTLLVGAAILLSIVYVFYKLLTDPDW